MFRFALFTILALVSFNLLGQSVIPKAIDHNLAKSFDKIDHWAGQLASDTTGTALDSLMEANDHFDQLLTRYIKSRPSTLNEKYIELAKRPISILNTADGRLRIFSWDTQTGGTQHANQTVFQYRSGSNVLSLSTQMANEDNLYNYFCTDVFTLPLDGKTYYLVIAENKLSSFIWGREIRILTVNNDGSLDTKAKLIKTQRGLTHRLSYSYAFDMDSIENPGIRYNPKTKTIIFPVIIDDKVTDKVITYKFNGKYFEKVKS